MWHWHGLSALSRLYIWHIQLNNYHFSLTDDGDVYYLDLYTVMFHSMGDESLLAPQYVLAKPNNNVCKRKIDVAACGFRPLLMFEGRSHLGSSQSSGRERTRAVP